MLRYLVRRLVSGVIALLGFLTAMFFGVQLLIPGDFVTPFRLTMTEQEVEALRAQLGLDQSLWIQYWKWLQALLSGELGGSTFGVPVRGLLLDVVPATLFVFVTGLAIAFLVGGWNGRWTAWNPGVRAEALTFTGLAFVTAFPPFLAFVLVTVVGPRLFDLRRALVDTSERGTLWIDQPLDPGQVLTRMTISVVVAVAVAYATLALMARVSRLRIRPWMVAGLTLVALPAWWTWQGYRTHAFDLVFDAAIPLLAFTLLSYGEFLLIMQTSMVATMNDDYVAVARAKGLSEKAIRDHHAAPNAVLPLMSKLAVSIPFLMTGLVIIERSVASPGLGDFLFRAIESQDIPVVMGAVAVVGFIALAARLLLDFVSVVVDPRLRIPARVKS